MPYDPDEDLRGEYWTKRVVELAPGERCYTTHWAKPTEWWMFQPAFTKPSGTSDTMIERTRGGFKFVAKPYNAYDARVTLLAGGLTMPKVQEIVRNLEDSGRQGKSLVVGHDVAVESAPARVAPGLILKVKELPSKPDSRAPAPHKADKYARRALPGGAKPRRKGIGIGSLLYALVTLAASVATIWRVWG